jgi:hypothetical protein
MEKPKKNKRLPARSAASDSFERDEPPANWDGEVEKGLSAIYETEEGEETPDMTRIDRQGRSWGAMIFVTFCAFILFLLAAVWIGFAVFKPFRGFQGQGLQLTIDGPQNVSLGQESTYFINYQNAANEPLAAAEFRVNFPTDFHVTSLDPEPASEVMSWRLGTISTGGRGTVTVRGVFSGALGTKTAIQVVGSYRPASFNSDFETLTTKELAYTESVLSGSLDVPAKALPGDKLVLNYQLANLGVLPQKNLEARVTLPEGFVPDSTSSTNVRFEERLLHVTLPELAGGASTTVAVSGSFVSGFSGDASIKAETGQVDSTGNFSATQHAEATIAVLAGDLSLTLVANGSQEDRAVDYSEVLRFALGYENLSPEELKNVSIRVTFEPTDAATSTATSTKKNPSFPIIVDWSKLDAASSGTHSGNTLTWDKNASGVFEHLLPQGEGTLEFAVPVMGTSASATVPTMFQAVAEATMTLGNTKVVRTIRTRPLVFRLKSDVKPTNDIRYFSEEGAPVGSGPLPPVVGQGTTYRVHWEVAKTVHALKDVKLTAVLPKNVEWVNNATTTAGDLGFDEASRTLTWKLNRMPLEVGEAHADFDLKLTPLDLDVGRFAPVLGEVSFEATDMQINDLILKLLPALTTDLQNDEGAKSKGVVRKS